MKVLGVAGFWRTIVPVVFPAKSKLRPIVLIKRVLVTKRGKSREEKPVDLH
jgi:hypothetical protein